MFVLKNLRVSGLETEELDETVLFYGVNAESEASSLV